MLPPDYAEALRRADERANRREVVVTVEEAKRLFHNALTLETARSHRALEVDDANLALFSNLALWLAKEPGGMFAPDKGIGLLGGVGTGKTLALRAVRRCLEWVNSPRLFTVNVCASVFEDVKADPDSIAVFKSGARCFDDLGDDNGTAVNFGNRVDVMPEIISARHRKFVGAGLLTHFSTNLTLELLESQYGSRVTDRLTEMCDFGVFRGESRRR